MSLFDEIDRIKAEILDTERMLELVGDHPLMSESLRDKIKILKEQLKICGNMNQYSVIENIKKGGHPQFILKDEMIKCRCGHNAVWWKTGYICGTITAYPCKYN